MLPIYILCLAITASSLPVFNVTSAEGFNKSEFRIPTSPFYRVTGQIIGDNAFHDYLESTASFVQLTNCKEPVFESVEKKCFTPFFEDLSEKCTSDIEFVGFVRPKPRGTLLDVEKLPYMKATQKAGIFIDHMNKRIVVALRSNVDLLDHYPFLQEGIEYYSPQVYSTSMWKNLTKISQFRKDFGEDNLNKVYDAKKNKFKMGKSVFKRGLYKIHVGSQEYANRLFEELLVKIVSIQKKIGIDNTLVTFNEPRFFSKYLVNYYNSLSELRKLHSLVVLERQDELPESRRGHFRVWMVYDDWTSFPANPVFSVAKYFNPFVHSGLSVVTPMYALYENEEQRFLIESKYLEHREEIKPRTIGKKKKKERWSSQPYSEGHGSVYTSLDD
ncbi:hypothetical protein HII13_004323 [Brettanomyces bruxellensis]|nr:hypothetical protein HII13_004323 [Brettanomyces bruxellensis]